MMQAAAPAPRTAPPGSPKQRYADVYAREHATTLRVLKAFPADRASYRPHERSKSALELAWIFVVENNAALAALRGSFKVTGVHPPPPPSYGEVVAAYEASARELMHALPGTPEARLDETVRFFTAPKQMGDVPVGDLLWFMLLDSIHHRGQLSVYVRCAGGKVPSIYGPSADEPWT